MAAALLVHFLAGAALGLELIPDPPVEGRALLLRSTEPAAAIQWTVNRGQAPPESLRPPGTFLESRSATFQDDPGRVPRSLELAVSPAARGEDGAFEIRIGTLPLAVWQICARTRARLWAGWGPIGRCSSVAPGPALRLPRFSRAPRRRRVATRQEALVGGVAPEVLALLPRHALTQAEFDRVTESSGLELRWHSADLTSSEMERQALLLQGALEALNDFFGNPAPGIPATLCYRKGSPKAEFGGHGLTLGNVIYFTGDEFPVRLLIHELVHLVQLRTVRRRKALAVPVLVEGTARFVEYAWSGNPRRIHSEARAALAQRWKPLSEMDRTEFYLEARVEATYTLAGSFAGYLLERFGLPRLQRVLNGSSFEAAFGRPGRALESDWIAWLGQF
ncbi:MAG: hypothetical protein HY554_08395 [Elusimicrobia bacterium]|nr:hypothetical protein [Elusimicrobiota bacterium]